MHFLLLKRNNLACLLDFAYKTLSPTSSWSGISLAVSGLAPGGSNTQRKSPTGSFLVLAASPFCPATLTNRSLNGSSLSTSRQTCRFSRTGLEKVKHKKGDPIKLNCEYYNFQVFSLRTANLYI